MHGYIFCFVNYDEIKGVGRDEEMKRWKDERDQFVMSQKRNAFIYLTVRILHAFDCISGMKPTKSF